MVSHWWPGITPFNVYDLRLGLWAAYAETHDAWLRRESADG